MSILGLDVGSSSVKAGIVRAGKILGRIARDSYPTHCDGPRVEVDPERMLRAIAKAIGQLGPAARKVEAIGLSVMSPAWIAMDRAGKPLTRLVTHQDRRSVEIARELERRVGAGRYLAIAGNLPFPGGISVTTATWFVQHAPAVMRRADLIGHLNTFLHRQITGARVIDPSNASFTGLYETVRLGGWSELLCKAARITISKLPEIYPSNQIAGYVTPAAARHFGLRAGTPVVAGMVDTSAAMMLSGAAIGQLFNMSGSTDVLGLCTAKPRPHPKLLTRALGVGRRWMSVGTLAAGGSTVEWVKDQFYRDMSERQYYALVGKLARQSKRRPPSNDIVFEPYLAGERTSIEQKQASFRGLTLATTRDDLLLAVIDALARASGARLELLKTCGVRMLPRIVISGGAARILHDVLHRDWHGRWTFKFEDEASLRGLSAFPVV
jgi:sugar (pentulose or hexulose) kinase